MALCFFERSLVSAQVHDTTSAPVKWHQKTVVKTLKIPLALTATGLLISTDNNVLTKYDIQSKVREQYPDFSSSLDDYLRYVPPAAVFIMDPLGNKAKNSLKDRSLLFLKANLFAMAVTFPAKGITRVRRPDGSSSASMPSLHTAQAFLGAQFLHREYGHKSIWYSVAGYSMATVTGAYRILNDKHWAPDVLIGAAVGILSTEISYLTHVFGRKKKRRNRSTALLLPAASSDYVGATFSLQFK